MGKTEVILQVIAAVVLTVVYFKLCSDRECSKTAKILELTSLYGINILSMLGKVKFWTALAAFAVVGIIKFLTTKKVKVEREHTGMDI